MFLDGRNGTVQIPEDAKGKTPLLSLSTIDEDPEQRHTYELLPDVDEFVVDENVLMVVDENIIHVMDSV